MKIEGSTNPWFFFPLYKFIVTQFWSKLEKVHEKERKDILKKVLVNDVGWERTKKIL